MDVFIWFCLFVIYIFVFIIIIISIFWMRKAYLLHIFLIIIFFPTTIIVVIFVLHFNLRFLSLEEDKPQEFPLYAETLNLCYKQDIIFFL